MTNIISGKSNKGLELLEAVRISRKEVLRAFLRGIQRTWELISWLGPLHGEP